MSVRWIFRSILNHLLKTDFSNSTINTIPNLYFPETEQHYMPLLHQYLENHVSFYFKSKFEEKGIFLGVGSNFFLTKKSDLDFFLERYGEEIPLVGSTHFYFNSPLDYYQSQSSPSKYSKFFSWGIFESEILFLCPQIVFWWKNKTLTVSFFLLTQPEKTLFDLQRLFRTLLEKTHLQTTLPTFHRLFSEGHISHPSYKNFYEHFQKVSQLLEEKKIDKIVLGQFKKFFLPKVNDISFFHRAFGLFYQQCEIFKDTYQIYYAPLPQSTLCSVTPERFFSLEKTEKTKKTEEDDNWFLEFDCLAGTFLKQNNLKANSSPKLKKEHALVEDHLKKIALDLEIILKNTKKNKPPSILNLPNVSHFYSSLRSKNPLLKEKKSHSIPNLLSHFHPTLALGGQPKEQTKALIKEYEEVARGPFGSPVGILWRPWTEFAVCIRSCLLLEKSCYIFAGAGIIQESDFHEEWQEIQKKLEVWQNFLPLYPHFPSPPPLNPEPHSKPNVGPHVD